MLLGMPILYEYQTIEENVKLAKKLELDFIELNLNFSYCRREMEQKRVAQLLEDNNLTATLHFYDEADFAGYDEVVYGYFKLLNKYIKLGKNYLEKINIHLCAGPYVTVSGDKKYLYERENDEYFKRLYRNLCKVRKICAKYKIQLVLENTTVLDFLVPTFIDLASSGFIFTYDVGHDHYDGYKLKAITSKLTIKEMHIHDGDQKKCHLSLGTGTIDIGWFKKLAKENDAYVVIEVKSSQDLIDSVSVYQNLPA